ncbi:MAG: glycosyltransferase [Chloroflexi bacterium]|nr:MAG: glycosyltransferase [Chloroflexota bacterium]
MSELVTVVVPARNEEANIGPCLQSILKQDWANLQVLVIDGASSDRTAAIIREFARHDRRVESLVNPEGTIPGSLNLALRAARGSWFIRVDAHASVPPDYVRRLVHHLESGDWGGVGGRKDGQGITPAGRAIAAAMASPFGVGNSTYHHGRRVRTVDHIPFGAYPTALVRELGGWDERLLANEDFEFDYRLRRHGGKLLFDPELKIGWQCRQAVPDLFHQYRRYGRGKADVARLHPASLQPRHVVAPGLLGSWLGALLLLPVVRMLAALPFAVYLLGLAFATAHTSRGLDRRARPYLAAAFLAMHVGWGLGFWEGLIHRKVGRATASHESPSPSGGGQGGGLARAALNGVAWQGASFFAGKALVLVSTAILARLLSPTAFGVVALALVFITFADVVTDLGVAQALVFFPADRRRNDAALVVCLAVSGAFVGLAMLAAPLVASFFGHPEITGMFRVLSLALLVRATGQVPDALLRKSLRFRPRTIAELNRALFQGVASVVLAVVGYGPWAIIDGYLLGCAVWSLLLWRAVPYRPDASFWRLRGAGLRPLLRFGAPAAGTAFLLCLVFNVDYLIVGRLLGARALAYYTLGFRIPELVIISVFNVISVVAFPLFSRVRDDEQRLHGGYLFGLRVQAIYGVAAGVGLAMAAPMIVHVVFGDRWDPAIVPLEALALYAAFRSLGLGPHEAFRGIGRPDLLVKLSLLRFAVVVPALLIGVKFGIAGVSWAQAAAALPLALIMQAVASRVLGIPLAQIGRSLRPAVAVSLGVALAMAPVRFLMVGPESIRLALAILAGVAGAALAIAIADRRFTAEITRLVVPRSDVRLAVSAE